jgi:hypothetical protein
VPILNKIKIIISFHLFRLTVERDHSSSEGDTEGSDRTEPLKMKRQLHKTRKVFKKSLRLSSDQMVSYVYCLYIYIYVLLIGR